MARFRFVDGPNSLNCTLPAALSADPLPSRSVHVRASVWPAIGFRVPVSPSACSAKNFPTDVFNAVLPVPNKSYEAPTRIVQSVQQEMQVTESEWRAGTNRPAETSSAG